MDVTSLLNLSSVGSSTEKACPGQTPVSSTTEDATSPPQDQTSTFDEVTCPQPSEYQTTSRTRRPWDGDGYLLPSLESRAAQFPLWSGESNSSMSPMSPQHRSSNSSSSLDSLAPSLKSGSHSRFSSRSTVSGCPAVTGTGPDLLSELAPERKAQVRLADLSKKLKDNKHAPPKSRARGGGSSMSGLGRPRSPSDAVLISRNRPDSGRTSHYDIAR